MSSFFPLSPPAHSFFIGPLVINIHTSCPLRLARPGKGKEAMAPPPSHSSERGGGAADSGPSRHRPILRRDRESIDCDMLDRSNTELSSPLRHPVTTGDGTPLDTGAMLMDPDTSNPLMPLSSAACPVPTVQPPRNRRSPKAKKQHKWSKNGHGGHQRREFKNQGWKSSGPHHSDSSL